MKKYSFPPVADELTQVLILGSLPGEASLLKSQYYAHPRNQFWHLLGDVLECDLVGKEYADRLTALLAYRVGLWDVVASAERKGSLDTHIRSHDLQELSGFVATLPRLKLIAFNGGTAARLGQKALGINAGVGHDVQWAGQMILLPSSSPAYTMAYQAKLAQWQLLRHWLA